MFGLVTYILLAPIVAFTIVILLGKRLPRGGDWISLFAIWSGLAASVYLFFTKIIAAYDPAYFESFTFNWVKWGDFQLKIGFAIDNVAISMLVVVTIVSAVVHLYSVGYMHGDPKYSRFFAFLGLFSFSMLGLVLADNLLIIYAFWELVGLSSYLLIGFWHEKDSAANAGKKAFIVNRIGDAGMLVGILLVFSTLGTVNLHEIADGVAAGKLAGGLLTATGIMLFCGAVGKSAQFPLHVWLPDAMEGPTPVSALIHAATMVAAGVYLVARLFTILTFDASLVIAYVGGFTALFAATIAVAQYDIKRVLAYSTLSQLGYMVMALGVGSYMAGYFHLVTHAMFKACLFLGSGSVIHAMHHAMHKIGSHEDAQDMRFMGGLRKFLPTTFITFLIATLALSGVPFFSGFLSKDAILGGSLAFAMIYPKHWLLPVFGFSAAILTAFYMFRLIYMTFAGKFRLGEEAEKHLHESPKVMTIPLVILATLSIFIFYTLPSINPASANGGWFAHLFPNPPRAYERVIAHEVTPASETVHHEEATPVITDEEVDSKALAGEAMVEGEVQSSDVDVVTLTEITEEAIIQARAIEHTETVEQPSEVVEHHDEMSTEHGEAEEHAVAHHDEHEAIHHKAHNLAMIISIFLAGLGILIATMGYHWGKIDPAVWQRRLGVIYRGMFRKWWMDEIYNATAVRGALLMSTFLSAFDLLVIDGIVNGVAFLTRIFAYIESWFDLHVVDGLVNLTAWIVGVSGKIVRLFQGGQIQRYILYSLVLVGLFIVFKAF